MKTIYRDFYKENNFYPSVWVEGLTVKYNIYYTEDYNIDDLDIINNHKVKIISIDAFNEYGDKLASFPLHFLYMDFFKDKYNIILSAIIEDCKEHLFI